MTRRYLFCVHFYTTNTKIVFRDFLYLDIHSETAFTSMDRNKDGFITKGELKLAKKKMTMKEVDQVNMDLLFEEKKFQNLSERFRDFIVFWYNIYLLFLQ